MLPRHRLGPEFFHGADGQLHGGRQGGQETAVSRCLVRRGVTRVHHDIGAAGAGELPPASGEVTCHHRADAAGLEHADDRQADGTAADHDRHVMLLDLRAADRVPADRQRLGEDGELGREPVGEREHERLLDHHLLGVRTRRRRGQADRMQLVAAPGQRHRDHGRPGRALLPGCWPVSADLSGELVAEHHLLTGTHEAVVADFREHVGLRVGMTTDVQVRSADAAAQNVDDHLTRSGHRSGQIDELQLGVLAHDGLHRVASLTQAADWRRRAATA